MSKKKNNGMHFGGSYQVYSSPYTAQKWLECIISGKDLQSDDPLTIDRIYITKVMYNGPATIIFWSDGTKTMTKCRFADNYSAEVGFITAYLKKVVGSQEVHDAVCSWVPEDVMSMKYQTISISDVRRKYKQENK